MKKSGLFLLPNLIGDHRHHAPFLPQSVDKVVATLDGLIAENPTAGRRYLSRFETKLPTNEIPIAVFNKKTPLEDVDFFLSPILEGQRWGFVSDAGLPCVADPGAQLVARARALGINIQAFVGPSSLMLALELSGLGGQNFCFHGYLPKDSKDFQAKVLSFKKMQEFTHLFIERPYKSPNTLQALIETLDDKARLCVAAELTTPDQIVMTQTIATWKKCALPNLDKKNVVFIVGC